MEKKRVLTLMSHHTEAKAFHSLQLNVMYQKLARRAVAKMSNPLVNKAFNQWREQVINQVNSENVSVCMCEGGGGRDKTNVLNDVDFDQKIYEVISDKDQSKTRFRHF